jgi:hypothetical protein
VLIKAYGTEPFGHKFSPLIIPYTIIFSRSKSHILKMEKGDNIWTSHHSFSGLSIVVIIGMFRRSGEVKLENGNLS